eukprot:SAG31_NODE_4541_length_3152_cov_1.717000_2_plen_277_part_00
MQCDVVAEMDIAVTDSGTGIRPEDFDKLFVAYSQISPARSQDQYRVGGAGGRPPFGGGGGRATERRNSNASSESSSSVFTASSNTAQKNRTRKWVASNSATLVDSASNSISMVDMSDTPRGGRLSRRDRHAPRILPEHAFDLESPPPSPPRTEPGDFDAITNEEQYSDASIGRYAQPPPQESDTASNSGLGKGSRQARVPSLRGQLHGHVNREGYVENWDARASTLSDSEIEAIYGDHRMSGAATTTGVVHGSSTKEPSRPPPTDHDVEDSHGSDV